jgi:hypothetical protein
MQLLCLHCYRPRLSQWVKDAKLANTVLATAVPPLHALPARSAPPFTCQSISFALLACSVNHKVFLSKLALASMEAIALWVHPSVISWHALSALIARWEALLSHFAPRDFIAILRVCHFLLACAPLEVSVLRIRPLLNKLFAQCLAFVRLDQVPPHCVQPAIFVRPMD